MTTRDDALRAAAEIYVEAKIRIETERALSGEREAAAVDTVCESAPRGVS